MNHWQNQQSCLFLSTTAYRKLKGPLYQIGGIRDGLISESFGETFIRRANPDPKHFTRRNHHYQITANLFSLAIQSLFRSLIPVAG